MVFLKPASTSGVPLHPHVRPEFRHVAAKATKMIMERPNNTKTCLSTLGLIGFILIFILIIIPPFKEPESIETILRQRLSSSSRIKNEIVKRLLWSKAYLKVLASYEHQAAESYKNLLQNHLNSRRVVSIIRKEGNAKVAKTAERCKRVARDCSPQPYNLRGRLPIEKWITDIQKTSDNKSYHYLRKHEAIWSPRHCTARHSVAIIIPYRGRQKQLGILLRHLPTLLKRQHISYSIFVIEQTGNTTFNKGILMNAGFLTALARPAHGVIFHCFVFHDVDLLAEDDRNMYTCPQLPRHMSVAVDEFDYELPYSELLGGVFAIKTEHFVKVNGYSNSYWGWGGEDDDMGLRVKSAFGQVSRPDRNIGRYSSIRHPKLRPLLPLDVRRRLKKMTRIRYKIDGLNTVKYNLVKVEEKHQYTHVLVDVGMPSKDVISLYRDTMPGHGAFHMLNSEILPPLSLGQRHSKIEILAEKIAY